eukprot:364536-Pleurochrysis_carterae.AAC.1
MLADIQAHSAAAREGLVQWRRACTLVGRLCNLSQIYPELKPVLRGGLRQIEADDRSNAGLKAGGRGNVSAAAGGQGCCWGSGRSC